MLNLGVFARTNLNSSMDNFLDVINEFDKAFVNKDPKICPLFHDDKYPLLSEVLTSHGLCFSFNIALAGSLFNLNLTSDDFHHQIFITCSGIGSRNNRGPESLNIPANDTSYPNGLTLAWNYYYIERDYRRNISGTYLYLHDPYEMPTSSSAKFIVNKNRDGYIKVLPKINMIDESIISYKPNE